VIHSAVYSHGQHPDAKRMIIENAISEEKIKQTGKFPRFLQLG